MGDPAYVWLLEGHGYPGGNEWTKAEVYSTLSLAEQAARGYAANEAVVCNVYRAPLDAPAARELTYSVDSASRWGMVIPAGQSRMVEWRCAG